MLQLTNIRKNYDEGDHVVRALRGVSLQFRKSEFVSILGPSGCGKTTLLNIIGGLDRYTDGDLQIAGRSTKSYKDRDWDAYRNHSIGFVFQSYHLIPHQSVLQNVELALTLSGVPRKERRRRAREALEQVGLGDQLRKRPCQMSGGQMQRVAIARALVNDPEIILADEPTGALDTETSIQVMDILRRIAKDRLVIMVTHNPELAQEYSTRIIKMVDGQVISDSAPLSQEEQELLQLPPEQKSRKGRKKLPGMSFATSFGLSLKNLFTKKGRTALTAFAGSIGIIGIALIFAVSQGTTVYIQSVQEDTLTAYPLTLEATTVDLGTLMQIFMGGGSKGTDHPKDGVYSQSALFDLVNALTQMETTENDLASFRDFFLKEIYENPESGMKEAVNGIQYTYDLDLLVYTRSTDGQVIISDTQQLLMDAITENMGVNVSGMLQMRETMTSAMGGSSMMMSGGMELWCPMLSGMDGELVSPVLREQYDLVCGTWPKSYDQVVLVLDENNELSDLTLYALGLKSKEEIDAIFQAAAAGEKIETTQERWDYQELLNMEFRVVANAQCYVKEENTGIYGDLRLTDAGRRYLYDNGTTLKVCGILRPDPDAGAAMLQGSIAYTQDLTDYIMELGREAQPVLDQQAQPETDVFTGLPFRGTAGALEDSQKEAAFRERVGQMDQEKLSRTYIAVKSIPSREELRSLTDQALEGVNREQMQQTLVQVMEQQMSMSTSQIQGYVEKMTDQELIELYASLAQQQILARLAAQAQQQLAPLGEEQLAGLLKKELPDYTTEQCAQYYDEVLEFSDSTLEENLRKLGYVDPEKPASMNIYASSFENKDVIEAVIARYNGSVEELKQIRYTDYVGLIMSSVTTIINAITYVLIAFVAISLVVSSIMIGVITLISVQERTREIGILRAIGASKANVSGMFNAETVIIGFTSGLLGVALTWLACIPINSLIYTLTGIPNLRAWLPWQVAVVLVGISMLLTLISGVIPSRSAARKDPVVALRTE